ncbi:MAG: HEAT repeat domain-containing protein [Halanaerobacter sp.]
MIRFVVGGIYLLAAVSGLVFLLLLFEIIYNQILERVNQKLKPKLKEEINNYLAGAEVNLTAQISTRKKSLMEDIIMNYLRQLRGETKEKLRDFAEQYGVIDFKIGQLVDSSQWWKKSEAAYALGELGSAKAVEPLLDYLDNKNSDIRYQSALALVKIEGSKYLELAINSLLELDFYPRAVILRLIEEVEEDIYETMESLINSAEVEKKMIALRALGLKQNYRVLTWIREYIKSQNQDLVIASLKAAYQLGDLGDEEYFALLLTTKESPSPQVRSNLARTLEKFRTNKSRRELKDLMTDIHWEVRYNAAQSLLAHGEAGILALSEQLNSSDQFAQDMAWQILHQEITFNNLLAREDFDNYQELITNIKDYLANKEGVEYELESYFS